MVLRDMGKKSANPGNSLGHDVRTVVQPSPSPFFQILQDPESSPSAPSSPPLFLDSRALIITAAVCWATSEVLSIGQIHLILKMLQCSEAAGVPILPVAKAGLKSDDELDQHKSQLGNVRARISQQVKPMAEQVPIPPYYMITL